MRVDVVQERMPNLVHDQRQPGGRSHVRAHPRAGSGGARPPGVRRAAEGRIESEGLRATARSTSSSTRRGPSPEPWGSRSSRRCDSATAALPARRAWCRWALHWSPVARRHHSARPRERSPARSSRSSRTPSFGSCSCHCCSFRRPGRVARSAIRPHTPTGVTSTTATSRSPVSARASSSSVPTSGTRPPGWSARSGRHPASRRMSRSFRGSRVAGATRAVAISRPSGRASFCSGEVRGRPATCSLGELVAVVRGVVATHDLAAAVRRAGL